MIFIMQTFEQVIYNTFKIFGLLFSAIRIIKYWTLIGDGCDFHVFEILLCKMCNVSNFSTQNSKQSISILYIVNYAVRVFSYVYNFLMTPATNKSTSPTYNLEKYF